jgi:arabinofuranan 3-O-arabinosyltransferase
MSAPTTARSPGFVRTNRLELLAFALLSYVPFLLSSPGRVSADTKQYLYLDPARLLARAPYLWDPHVAAGTVPHQNVGYLFPLGPYYWAMGQLGVPDWVAQRLWLGTVSFAAAAGVLWLVSMLGVRRAGAIAAAVVYVLTPYQLAFTARISVILLPWAALPWLVGLTARALSRRGWRDPVLFALVAMAAGSVNASALMLVGIAPLLWLVVAVAQRRATAGDAARTALRIAVPTVAVSLWWAVGLVAQARYGLPVLDVTESLRTVASVSAPSDLLRGLGNWFFSGADRVGPWLDQSAAYSDERVLAALTFVLPFAALVAAGLVRWKYRGFFVVLLVVGTIVGVGAWPYDDPSPIGQLFKDGSISSALALAFRNTPRVVPVIVLGVAALIGAGVAALDRRRAYQVGAAVAVGAVAVAAFLPVWRTGYLSDHVDRPEDVPAYWDAVARALDDGDAGARVLEIPGTPFSAYRWGNTVEPITPGLTDRAVLARELLPYGSPEGVDLLAAFDRRMQDGTLEPATVAVLARMLGADTVLVRSDLEYERYETPRPRLLWRWLTDPPAPGLGSPEAFGPDTPNRSALPPDAIDATLAADTDPPRVALFPVDDPQQIVRAESAARPVVLAGSGDGIVDAAAAGLLDGRAVVLLATALDREALTDALDREAALVVTDTNRKRARRWDRLRDDVGATERAGQQPSSADTEDHRVDGVQGATDADRTVVEQRGGTVDASAYGPSDRYYPDDRPALALDGDPTTAWRVRSQPGTEPSLVFRPARPVTADTVELVQPSDGPAVTRVAVRVNGGAPVIAELDPALRSEGQTIAIPSTQIRELEVTLLGTDGGPFTDGGLTEVRVGEAGAERRVEEITRVPSTLVRRAGTASIGHRLVYVLTRVRGPVDMPGRSDPERSLVRRIDVVGDREFSLGGTARAATGTTECRDDLVTIDDRPTSVRLVSDPAGGEELSLEGCEGPIGLDAGSHVIRSARGADTGVDVDRLVLTSAAGGAAAVDATARVGAPPPSPGATVTVTDEGPTSYDLRIASDGRPFWLVLGQSHNDGWRAETGRGRSLGEPQLVDGYANGWLVTPDRAGTFTVDLTWTQQRLVWVGFAASALAIIVCLGVLVVTRRRRAPALSAVPEVGRPVYGAARGSTGAAIAVGLSVGLASAVVSRWWIGVIVGVAGFVATRIDGARLPLVAAAPLAFALGELLDVPELGWLTVLLLAADLAVAWVRTRRDPARPGEDD